MLRAILIGTAGMLIGMAVPASAHRVVWHSLMVPRVGVGYLNVLGTLHGGGLGLSTPAGMMDLDGDGVAELVAVRPDPFPPATPTADVIEIIDSKTGLPEFSFTTPPTGATPIGALYAYFDADPADPYKEVVVQLLRAGGSFVIVVISGSPAPGTAVESPQPSSSLSPGIPNPSVGPTTIHYSLRNSGRASLFVYDTSGRLVRKLAEGYMPAGSHKVTWDARDDQGRSVAAGTYFYRLVGGGLEESGKAVTLR